RAVARAHLGPAFTSAGRFLLGDHLVEQARAQHLERPDLVLELTLLVLALHHEIGGQVGNAHGAVGRVDALAARSLRAEYVDPDRSPVPTWARRSRARAASCSAIILSSRRERSTSSALILFWS